MPADPLAVTSAPTESKPDRLPTLVELLVWGKVPPKEKEENNAA